MTHSIQDVNSFTKKIIFTYPGDLLGVKVQEEIKKKSNTVELKGFRKGKAPLSLVEQAFGAEIEMNALESFVSEKYFQVVVDENLNPIGRPTIANLNYKPREEISFEAVFEVVPAIQLDYNTLSSFSFVKDVAEVKDEDLQSAYNHILHDKSYYKETEANFAVKEKGCAAVINATIKDKDGNLVKEELDVEIHVGHHHHNVFQHGVEENLVGLVKGDKKEFSLIADQSFAEELKGKELDYQVEILEVKEEVRPELNDELAVEMGFKTLKDMEDHIRKDIYKKRSDANQDKLQKEIFDKIYSEFKFEVPLSLIDMEIQEAKKQMKSYWKGLEEYPELLEQVFNGQKEKFEGEAKFRVVRSLLIGQMIRDWKLDISDEEIEKEIAKIVLEENQPEKEVRKYLLDGKNNEMNFRYHLLTEKVLGKLLTHVKVQ